MGICSYLKAAYDRSRHALEICLDIIVILLTIFDIVL